MTLWHLSKTRLLHLRHTNVADKLKYLIVTLQESFRKKQEHILNV